MKDKYTQGQRMVIAIIYIISIAILYSLLVNNIFLIDEKTVIWFYTGSLLLIIGTYLIGPYFSKPTDVVANTISAFIALLSIQNKKDLFWFYYVFTFVVLVLLLSVITILIRKKEWKIKNIIFWVVKVFGRAEVIFSLIFLLSSFSYFRDNIPMLVISFVFWLSVIRYDFVGLIVKSICNLISQVGDKKVYQYVGTAIECCDFKQYTIEVASDVKENINTGDIVGIKSLGKYNIAIINNKNILLNNEQVEASLLRNNNGDIIQLEPKELGIEKFKSVFVNELEAVKIDVNCLSDDIKDSIYQNQLYVNRNEFVGFIGSGSDINIINFSVINNETVIKEGSIVETDICGVMTLFQVINGITKEEREDKNSTLGTIKGIARKLGFYNYDEEELDIVKWVPQTFQPVYLHHTYNVCHEELNQIALRAIGRLPGTNMSIPIKDFNSLVTHGTAILGILGIGKSCLAFELIKKISERNIKIICIDITNQYYPELCQYMPINQIKNDLDNGTLALLRASSTRTGNPPLRRNNPRDWGNTESYTGFLEVEIRNFIQSQQRVFIINPENHIVTKAAGNFNIEELEDLTTTEKTQIISEEILKYYKNIGITTDARCLIVYEEAHSLIPETINLNTNEKNAVSATSRVILQGRKYGLGCCVVTQRTANVTKSILNQCNSVFALRVFDDTGKLFLENYLGQDYSELLPVLEERHAIIIGKGFRLKQPVIIQLNNRGCFVQTQNN